MNPARRRALITSCAVTIVLNGAPSCTTTQQPDDAPAQTPHARSPTTRQPPPDAAVDYHGGTHDPDPQPTLATNDAVIKAGRQTVRELVAAFIAQRPYQQWWQHVAPLLSQRIRADYQHVDPANVPGTAITGDVQLDLHPSGRVATAVVPTDAGDYTIVISRTDTHARWVAERITPPAQRAP